MSLLKKLFSRSERDEQALERAPALRQMMKDLEKEENEFLERLEKILPVIRFSPSPEDASTSPEGLEHRSTDSAQPVSFPINFDDDLVINLCLSQGEKTELLLNRHIEVAGDKITADQIVNKAYGNLFRQVENSISISMISKEMGMVSGCNGMEASLVLVNEIWSLIRKNLNSDEIVFGIPSQDFFIFTSAEWSDAVEKLNQKITERFDDPSLTGKICSKLYIMHKDGRSEVFRQ